MTPIEDMLSGALRVRADEIGPGTVPPLRLRGRRRSRSLAHGGGESTGAPAWRGRRGWLAAAGCAALVAAVAAGSVAISHLMRLQAPPNGGAAATGNSGRPSAALRLETMTSNLAAAWVVGQVSHDVIVSCDQLMCADLEAHGFPTANVRVLAPTSPYPLSSTLVIETAAVRKLFGTSLSSEFATAVLATLGSGSAQITIRVVAPQGAAAYQRALSQDLAVSKQAAEQLLRTTNDIETSATARSQLASGLVDLRLLVAITALDSKYPIDIVDFGNIATGASADVPFRYADLAYNDTAAHMSTSAYLQSILAVLAREPSPYRPARAQTVMLAGKAVLRIEFAAPSPLGLLGPTSNSSH
jgi:hypothetical protein